MMPVSTRTRTLAALAGSTFFIVGIAASSTRALAPAFAIPIALLAAGAASAAVLLAGRRRERTASLEDVRLASAISSAGDAIITTSAAGTVVLLNRRAEELTGYPLAEALGKPIEEVFRPLAEETRRPLESPARRVLIAGREEGRGGRALLLDREGGARLIEESAAPIRGPRGKVAGAVIVFRAITEVNTAQSALRRNEDRLRLAFEASRLGLWEWDLRTDLVSWSPTLEEIHGLAPGSFAGTFEAAVRNVHAGDRGLVRWAIERVLTKKTEQLIQYRLVLPDGQLRWVEGRGKLLSDESGKPAMMVGVLMDITERKALESSLRRRAEALSAADGRKEEVLAMLAQELRSPLGPLRNAVQILTLAPLDAPHLKEAREVIARQVRYMARLVDDLLDLSRLIQGDLQARKERVELGAILARTGEAVRPLVEEGGLELILEPPPAPVHLEADPTRLEQVLFHLVQNAVKFSEPGARIRLSGRREGGEAVLRVEDTGVGIAPDALPRLFEMFVEADRERCGKQGGLGIGLALSRGLMELQGGRLEGRSDGPGKGSAFEARLPALAFGPEAVPAAQGRRGTTGGAPSLRVLLVDDRLDAARGLEMLLSLDGHRVETVSEPEEALGAARAFRPDVVILDVDLAGEEGSAIARRLREVEETRSAVLVAVTGLGEDGRRRSLEAGFDEHLLWPVEPAALRSLLAGFRPASSQG